MKILILSQFAELIEHELPPVDAEIEWVRNVRDFDLAEAWRRAPFDLLVCFGYGRILPVDDPTWSRARFVNLHTGFLPWGRGMNPNFRAWLNGEPHGVTVHEMDGRYDGGAVLFQKRLDDAFDIEHETLRSTYWRKLHEAILLLAENWPRIVAGDVTPRVQPETVGSLTTSAMLKAASPILTAWNDRPLSEFLAAVARGEIARLPDHVAASGAPSAADPAEASA